MTTENSHVEDQDQTVDQPGADQGDEWGDLQEQQLFGDQPTAPKPGKASEDVSEERPEIPLEAIQTHPVFQDLQSKFDRQTNVLKYQTDQLNQYNEQIKTFRDKQAADLLAQLGDTEEARNAVALIQKAQDTEAQAMAIMQQFGPLLKQEKGKELLTNEGIPMEYLPDIVACETFDEAVQTAKAIKAVLARQPKPPPAQKSGQTPGGSQKARTPAMSHIPDRAQGSIQPQSFDQAEQAYIDGKISFSQYKAVADKAGVQLQ